jgi:energy-coupling factor transporter transmembrane protein EcfT
MSEIVNLADIKTDHRNRWKFSLLACVTFVLALVMTIAIAIVWDAYGLSTAGILIVIANFPGMIVGIWAGSVVGEVTGYILSGLVNWAFYFYASKGLILLKRRFSPQEVRLAK